MLSRSDQHPIEWVAMMRREVGHSQCVHRQHRKTLGSASCHSRRTAAFRWKRCTPAAVAWLYFAASSALRASSASGNSPGSVSASRRSFLPASSFLQAMSTIPR